MKQIELEPVEIIASGYEWICPKCEALNKIHEIPQGEIVKCIHCNTKFRIEDFYHAYG